jgi:flagellar basal body-associated protein FliL
MKENEESSGRSKVWIWILVIILMGLLAVPFMAMGVALKKVGMVSFMNHPVAALQSAIPTASTNADVPPEHPEMTGLRAKTRKGGG